MGRYWIAILAISTATSAFAQDSDPKAVQNAENWKVFEQFYPKRAVAAKEEGAVGFKVTLDSKGLVTDCQITHSSGHPLLDQETCNIITRHAQFKPAPGLSPSQAKTSEGMIAWKLPASAASLPAPKPVQPAELDKVVCKKNVRTGTLADVERTCMTVREWARESTETRDFWEDLQGKKASTHGN